MRLKSGFIHQWIRRPIELNFCALFRREISCQTCKAFQCAGHSLPRICGPKILSSASVRMRDELGPDDSIDSRSEGNHHTTNKTTSGVTTKFKKGCLLQLYLKKNVPPCFLQFFPNGCGSKFNTDCRGHWVYNPSSSSHAESVGCLRLLLWAESDCVMNLQDRAQSGNDTPITCSAEYEGKEETRGASNIKQQTITNPRAIKSIIYVKYFSST